MAIKAERMRARRAALRMPERAAKQAALHTAQRAADNGLHPIPTGEARAVITATRHTAEVLTSKGWEAAATTISVKAAETKAAVENP